MSAELPGTLRGAIEQALDGVSRKGLAERAALTSQAYRAGQSSAAVIRETDDVLAYAITRLPATYAACAAALGEAARMAPGFAPASLLDAGVGTGAASWAALETWPGVRTAAWLDSNPAFLALAARFAAQGPPALRQAQAQRVDLLSSAPWPKADLVLASYALAEIAADRQVALVIALWAACDGVLALVEPGTPAGYRRILTARAALIDAGADILAPCPHAQACPLVGEDWCHFSVRLPRSRDHRLAKGAEVPFEDERFSYLIAARPTVAAIARMPRVIAPPQVGKPGIALKLCTPAGLERWVVGKRDKTAFAVTRRLDWGDVVG